MDFNNMFAGKSVQNSMQREDNSQESSSTLINPTITDAGVNEELTVRGTPKKKTINGKYAGRRKTKTEPEKVINIAVPVSLYEQMNIAKLKYHNNLTAYVNHLIQEDISKNLDTYEEVQRLLQL